MTFTMKFFFVIVDFGHSQIPRLSVAVTVGANFGGQCCLGSGALLHLAVQSKHYYAIFDPCSLSDKSSPLKSKYFICIIICLC